MTQEKRDPLEWYSFREFALRLRQRSFDAVWHGLAERGKCDAHGGAEYRRIHQAWLDAGSPVGCTVFILSLANRPAGGAPEN